MAVAFNIESFDELFTTPFASHQWASKRGRSHWVELEGWQDAIAGPLLSVIKTGGCDYVYTRQDGYFSSVSGPRELRTRLLEWHAGLIADVERFDPSDEHEETDLEFMRSVASRMRELVEQACILEQDRWTASQHEPK